MIFSRGRGRSGRHARDRQERRAEARHSASRHDDVDPYGGDEADAFSEAAVPVGPYDISEAPEGVARLDLGSLKVPAIEGVEVRVQADPDGAIQQIVLVHGANALQLGVFAAPRSEGIWEDVRAEIRQSLLDDGVVAQEVAGEYGVELRARVSAPDGPTDIRFVGIDGPRWMVRGVYQGAAAVDPANAGPLAECLRGLVVDRGREAKPVREPLALRLPKEVAEQAAGATIETSPADLAGGGPAPVDGTRINGAAPGSPPGGTPRRKPTPRPRRTS
ncbi:MAG TPA: DUF3710 domain-containing protein [Pilimelia sp.]|nr:DUF3710 domain-containing protein [Pilimelia sp.]